MKFWTLQRSKPGITLSGLAGVMANPPTNAGANFDASKPATAFVPKQPVEMPAPYKPSVAPPKIETTQSPPLTQTIAPEAVSAAPSAILAELPATPTLTASAPSPAEIPSTPTAAPVAVQPFKESTVSTAPVTTTTKSPNEFIKILKKIGTVGAKILGVADKIEDDPVVQVAQTGLLGSTISGLIKRVIDTAQSIETASATSIANATSEAAGLTDTQKAALAVETFTSDAQQTAAALGANPLTQDKLMQLNNLAIQIAGLFEVPVTPSTTTPAS